MASNKLKVNNKSYSVEADAKMPLLWAVRDLVGLTRTWIMEQVPQCGYCQSGQIMSAAALLAKKPSPTDTNVTVNMTFLGGGFGRKASALSGMNDYPNPSHSHTASSF